MTISSHPADAISPVAVAKRVFESLSGKQYWDLESASRMPNLTFDGTENLRYTWDAIYEEGLTDLEDPDEFDFTSPTILEPLRKWTDARARICIKNMQSIPVIDGFVQGHRMIQCHPENLISPLGIFWTHGLENWPDPLAPWGKENRDETKIPTLTVEAMIPVGAIDWETSCTALCDWFIGDCESELRAVPGHPVRLVKITDLETGDPVLIPNQNREWIL